MWDAKLLAKFVERFDGVVWTEGRQVAPLRVGWGMPTKME